MMASKFLNDEGEEDEVINSDWANSAKLDLAELNQLEKQFLQAIVSQFFVLKTKGNENRFSFIVFGCLDKQDWHLFVDDEDFAEALVRIEFRVAQRESLKRGWLTYTDLDILARRKVLTDTWDIIYDLVLNVSIACMTAYLASLVTLVGSAIVVSSLPWNQCSISSPSQSTSSQPTTPTYVTTNSNASSSELHPEMEFLENLDLEEVPTISEITSQYLDLDSDTFLKDLTAVALGSYSHLPKPPYQFVTNETPIIISDVTVENFTDPLVYLQKSYCSLIRFQSNSFFHLPLCAAIA